MLRWRTYSWVLVFASLALCCGGTRGAEATGEGRYILERMRERDARFDNARLRYLLERTVTTDPFHDWKYGQRSDNADGARSQPRTYRTSSAQELVVRGTDTTFIYRPGPVTENESDGAPMPSRARLDKTSNVGGIIRELTEEGEGRSKYRDVRIRKAGGPPDSAQHNRMGIELSHGLGIGERIKDIDSVRRSDGGVVIEGGIQIWWEDESRFEIELDDDYVIRKAVIESNVRGNLTRYEVTTEGSVEKDGLVLAKRGTFKRIAQGRLEDGVRVGKPKVLREFSTTCEDVEFNLSDDEYARLTTIEITPGTWVRDSITGLAYRVGETVSLGPAGLDSESLLDVISLEADEAEPGETPVETVEREAPSPQVPLADSSDAAASRRQAPWPCILAGLLVLGAAAVLLIRRKGKGLR